MPRVGDALRAAAPGDASEWTSVTLARLAELPASAAEVVQVAYTDALVPVVAVLLLLVFLHPVSLVTRLDRTATT